MPHGTTTTRQVAQRLAQDYGWRKPVTAPEAGFDVTGDGSSLWGDSKATYHVDRLEFQAHPWTTEFATLKAFGDPEAMPFHAYTDRAIEQQIAHRAKQLFPQIVKLCWSEAGMNKEGAWDFDVTLVEKPEPDRPTDEEMESDAGERQAQADHIPAPEPTDPENVKRWLESQAAAGRFQDATQLAEAAAEHFCMLHWLDDPEHFLWEQAYDALERPAGGRRVYQAQAEEKPYGWRQEKPLSDVDADFINDPEQLREVILEGMPGTTEGDSYWLTNRRGNKTAYDKAVKLLTTHFGPPIVGERVSTWYSKRQNYHLSKFNPEHFHQLDVVFDDRPLAARTRQANHSLSHMQTTKQAAKEFEPNEGDEVRVIGKQIRGSGQHGTVVSKAPSGHFSIVEFNGLVRRTYHNSDLAPYEPSAEELELEDEEDGPEGRQAQSAAMNPPSMGQKPTGSAAPTGPVSLGNGKVAPPKPTVPAPMGKKFLLDEQTNTWVLIPANQITPA